MKKQLLLLTFIALCVPVLSARSEMQKPALAIIKPKPVVQPIIDPIKPVKPTKPITTQPIKPTPTNPTNPVVKPKPTIQPVRPITTPVIKPQPNLTEIGEIKKSVHSIVNDLDKKITAMQSAEKKNYLKYRILPQVKMYGVAYTRSGNAAEKKRFDAAVEKLKKEIDNAEKPIKIKDIATLQTTDQPTKQYLNMLDPYVRSIKKLLLSLGKSKEEQDLDRELKEAMHAGLPNEYARNFELFSSRSRKIIRTYIDAQLDRLESKAQSLTDEAQKEKMKAAGKEIVEIRQKLFKNSAKSPDQQFIEIRAKVMEAEKIFAQKPVTTQQVTTLQPTPKPGKPGTTQPTKPTLPVKPGPIVDPVKPPVTTQPVRPQPGLDIIRQRLEAKVKALSTDLANEKVMTAKLKTEASMLKKKITELEKKLTEKPKLPIATQPTPKPAPNKPTPNPAPKPEIKPAPIQAKPVKGDDETYGLTGAKLEYLKLYPVYRQEVTTFKNGSARKNAYAQYKKAITSARAAYRKDKDRNKYYATAKAAKAQYISATQAAKAKVTDLTTKLKKIYGIDSKTKSYIHKLFAYKSAAVNARYSENQRKKYKGYLDRIETYLRKITTQR